MALSQYNIELVLYEEKNIQVRVHNHFRQFYYINNKKPDYELNLIRHRFQRHQLFKRNEKLRTESITIGEMSMASTIAFTPTTCCLWNKPA